MRERPGLEWRGRYYTRTEIDEYAENYINYYNRRWTPAILSPIKERYLEISQFAKFSTAFVNRIGAANCRNIYGCENPYILEQFWYSYIERIVYSLHECEDSSSIFAILFFNTMYVLSDSGFPEISYGKKEFTSFVEYIGYRFNLPKKDSMMTISELLGYNICNIFTYNTQIKKIDMKLEYYTEMPNYFNNLLSNPALYNNTSIFYNKEKVVCFKRKPTRYDEPIGGAYIVEYMQDIFYIPASAYRNELIIGGATPKICFLNQDKLQENPQSLVILFQDLCAAKYFDLALNNSYISQSDNIIITAHLNPDLNSIPWNYLDGHHILFIPAPSKWHMALVPQYFDYLQNVDIQSFKISRRFFLAFPPNNNWRSSDGITHIEAELLQQAVLLEECSNLVQLFRESYMSGYTKDDYQSWAEKLDIFPPSQIQIDVDENKVLTPLPEPHGALNPPYTDDLSEMTLIHAFRPCNYVVVYGAKGSGKTSIGYALSQSFLYQERGLELFLSKGIEDENICYVDMESDVYTYNRLLEKCQLKGLLNTRFFSIWSRSEKLPSFCHRFDLRDEEFRNGLREYVLKHKCRYLFLDNLLALTHDDTDSCKQKILDWITQLTNDNLCVILFIHKDEDLRQDKKRSSQSYYSRATIAINLYGKREFSLYILPERVLQAAKSDSLTIGISFTENKSTPKLIGRTFWVHQRLGQSTWEYLVVTKGVDSGEDDVDYDVIRSSYHRDSLTYYLKKLSATQISFFEDNRDKLDSDEKIILAYALYKGSVQSGDLATLLPSTTDKSRTKNAGPQSTKSREILKGMVAKGCLIHNEKKGRESAYIPNLTDNH